MTHRKGAVWTERLVLALILASLGGTLNLVLAIHRRVHSTSIGVEDPEDSRRVTPPADRSLLRSPSRPLPPPSSPTKTRTLPSRRSRRSRRRTPRRRSWRGSTPRSPGKPRPRSEADRRAAAIETARQTSVAESQAWKRREMLVRQQVAALSQRADKLEQEAITLDAERDVLARERDALKAALGQGEPAQRDMPCCRTRGRTGPGGGRSCWNASGNTVKLQPNGPTFSMMELSPLIHPRSSPVVLAIAREMMHIQQAETPDGAPAVPYLVFLVRPDGIRPYYQARARLEPLGIAFGYELVEQDLAVDIPNFDDVRTWDGTKPLDIARAATRSLAAAGPPRQELLPAMIRGKSDQWTGHLAAPRETRRGNPAPTGDGPTWPAETDRAAAREGGSGSSGGGWAMLRCPRSAWAETRGRATVRGSRVRRLGRWFPRRLRLAHQHGRRESHGHAGNGACPGWTSADGSGIGNGFAGTPSTGLAGQGSSRSPGSPFSNGGGSGSVRTAGVLSRRAEAWERILKEERSRRADPIAGRLLARGGEIGRANVSSPGAGTGRGGTNSGRGEATGSGGGNRGFSARPGTGPRRFVDVWHADARRFVRRGGIRTSRIRPIGIESVAP